MSTIPNSSLSSASSSSRTACGAPDATAVHAFVDLSVVIPAYNEELRIAPTLEALHAFLATLPLRSELLVVDDGSRDGTVTTVEALRDRMPNLRVVRQVPNRGKGAAVRLGMLTARGPIRVMCDADGSMPTAEMQRLLDEIISHRADIAIGSRYVGGKTAAKQPLYRRLWSRLCNQVIQRSLVPGIEDTQCGFKAFTGEAARELFGRSRIDGWAFDLEILALARHRGYTIAEVGVTWVDDGRSRVNPLKDMWKVVSEAWTIRENLRRGVYTRPARRGNDIAAVAG
jgi:glycosyltransferase involved in cell wall biosynthesis